MWINVSNYLIVIKQIHLIWILLLVSIVFSYILLLVSIVSYIKLLVSIVLLVTYCRMFT